MLHWNKRALVNAPPCLPWSSLHLLDRRVTFAFVNIIAASILELRLELSFGPVVHGTSERSEVNSDLSKRRTCEQPQWG